MNFVLNRDRVVSTLSGHSIEFKKGVPTHVPAEAYNDVIAVGAAPESEIPEEGLKKSDVPEGEAREAAIFAAFEKIVLRNDPGEFTSGGVPRDGVLEAAVGFKVQTKEREAAWLKFKQGGGAK